MESIYLVCPDDVVDDAATIFEKQFNVIHQKSPHDKFYKDVDYIVFCSYFINMKESETVYDIYRFYNEKREKYNFDQKVFNECIKMLESRDNDSVNLASVLLFDMEINDESKKILSTREQCIFDAVIKNRLCCILGK